MDFEPYSGGGGWGTNISLKTCVCVCVGGDGGGINEKPGFINIQDLSVKGLSCL